MDARSIRIQGVVDTHTEHRQNKRKRCPRGEKQKLTKKKGDYVLNNIFCFNYIAFNKHESLKNFSHM